MQPVLAVLGQLKRVLETIPYDGTNAGDLAEWITTETVQDCVPEGQAFAAMTHGSNEGHHVNIIIRDSSGRLHPIFIIKYLTGKDFAYTVAQIVNEAFNEGLYTMEQPPMAATKKTGFSIPGGIEGHYVSEWEKGETLTLKAIADPTAGEVYIVDSIDLRQHDHLLRQYFKLPNGRQVSLRENADGEAFVDAAQLSTALNPPA